MQSGAGDDPAQDAPGADGAERAEQGSAAEERSAAEQVRALCERTLRSNWAQGERAGVPYAYTRPSPERYRWQWYWDSCFAAIVWRRLEIGRSREELRTLCAAAREDGFIGHTIFWEGPLGEIGRAHV